MEPAPIANTQSILPSLLSKPKTASKGRIMEAAVIMDTVEEPKAVFNMDVTIKGKQDAQARQIEMKAMLRVYTADTKVI